MLKVTTPDLQAQRSADSDFPEGHPSVATSSTMEEPLAFPPPQLRDTAPSHLSPTGLPLSGMVDTHKSQAVALGLLQFLRLSKCEPAVQPAGQGCWGPVLSHSVGAPSHPGAFVRRGRKEFFRTGGLFIIIIISCFSC